MDNLSEIHYRAVWAEIQGRFFSSEEAEKLKEDVDRHTVTDPEVRKMAAQTWERK
jgi:hypothetical protein